MNISLLRRIFGVPVIMFHGLYEQLPEYAVFQDERTCMLAVKDFQMLIDWITEHFQVIRLEDLNKHLASGDGKRPPVVLTFDDGLASVMDLALPILQEYRISAVLFVTIDWIDSGRTPDIFLLEKTIWENLPASLVVHIGDRRCGLQIDSKGELAEAFRRLWEFLFSIRFPPLKVGCENIRINGMTWERQKSEDRYFWFPASWEEIHTAVQTGVIEIGSHMVSHTPLSWLSDEEKLFQLKHSRDQLSKMIGSPVTACSYPHGHIDKKTISMSEKVYKWGFTNRPGRMRNMTNRNAAPRYHVPGEALEHIIETLRWGRTISRIKRVIFS